MAEHLVKFIPCLHTYRTNSRAAEAAAAALKNLTAADEATFSQTNAPEFVDCGTAPTRICCPRCGAELELDWWRGAMEARYAADHFFVLEEEMPCCGKMVSLNQLRYQPACGFSTLVFTLRNPRENVEKEATDLLSERFGMLFRRVNMRL